MKTPPTPPASSPRKKASSAASPAAPPPGPPSKSPAGAKTPAKRLSSSSPTSANATSPRSSIPSRVPSLNQPGPNSVPERRQEHPARHEAIFKNLAAAAGFFDRFSAPFQSSYRGNRGGDGLDASGMGGGTSLSWSCTQPTVARAHFNCLEPGASR